MSIGLSTNPTRDTGEGRLSLHEFAPGHELTRLEELIEERLELDPPSMFVDFDEDGDVLLTFALGEAFGEGGKVGPSWRFSLHDAFTFAEGAAVPDVRGMARALRSLAAELEARVA